MLKSHLVLALRNLRKQKLYAFVNIFGLAVGLACTLLILLYVQYELSFDRFHDRTDRIFRVVQRQPGNVFIGSDHFAVTPAPLARTLVDEFPEITDATTLDDQEALLSFGDQHFWESGLWADARFLQVFSFPMVQGNPETALTEPYSMLLTESLARKIFGDADPMGQTLLHQNQDTYTVTGILRDVPERSHITFDFVTTIQSQSNYANNLAENRWNNNSWLTYFVLADGVPIRQVEAKMPALVEKYVAEKDEPREEWKQYYIQALPDIHLRSHINFDIGTNGDIKYVYLFSAIALVILLLACINYTNLAVARSIKRAREVGMRKVVGARRRQLVAQFLGESVLMAFLALLLGLALVHLLLPLFGHLMERPLRMDYTASGLLVPGLLALVVLVGLLSGSYPALFMASLRPIRVLKGVAEGPVRKARMQRVLIVGQFAASIILVASSFIIYEQLQFVQNTEIGYDREHVVTVRVRDRALRERYATIYSEWTRNPNVLAVTSSGHLPTNIGSSTTLQGWEGSSEEDPLRIYQTTVDYDFLDVFGIPLVAGRTFSREIAGDTAGAGAYLINETAARGMGWTPQEAVGKHLKRYDGEATIIGVVKDFHMHSLHEAIEPLMLFVDDGWMGYLSARVRPNNLPETIAFLEKTVRKFTPYPFEYEFLDQNFDALYKVEIRLGETFGFFTVLALLIASLGLFGLAAFAAEQRTKEIGIRKVLGASAGSIVVLLSKEFTKLIIVAAVLAVPVAYLTMNRWLEDFAYRVEIGPGVFVAALAAALVIAWLSVSYQSFKAARVNPVESLKYE